MSVPGVLRSAALLLFLPGAGPAQEFPIGAWFPGLFNTQSEHFPARLDQVVEANFNTIHAALVARNDPSVNRVFMDLAHERGLKVQLYSWNVPPGWRAASRRYWTKTLEAESARHFVHPVGVRDGEGWHADTEEHDAGLLLDTPADGRGIFLKYREQSLNSRGQVVANRARYEIHVFRLKTDDNAGTEIIATLRILNHSDGALLRSRSVRKLHFHAADTYQDFVIRYAVPPGGARVRYQVDWTGEANLWVDRIRAHDRDGHRLFSGDFDRQIQEDLAAYDGVEAPRPWRFYADDEPQFTEKDESVAYVNRFIRAQSGKSGVVAFNKPDRDLLRHFVGTVFPSELLVDFYTFGLNVAAPGRPGYATRLQDALDSYVRWYGVAREVAREAGIPLWGVMQAHGWPGGLRSPSPEEIRVQVHLALAHGVTGIYYFMYASHVDADGRADLQGLVDTNYRITPKWSEVQALNRMLQEHAERLLQLTSEAVFRGDAPASFVERLSDPADYHLGTFTHRDGTRYLMVVNRRCQPSRRLRTVTIGLKASDLSGPVHSYLVTELYDKEIELTANGPSPSFTASFAPGEGKLFRIEPWDDHVALTGDVTIPVGVKLTLAAGSTVTFDPVDQTRGGEDDLRCELVVEGALDAGAGNITFRLADGPDAAGSWHGIRVARTGHADLSGATIRDGLRCVQAYETSTVDVTATSFINCGEEMERISEAP